MNKARIGRLVRAGRGSLYLDRGDGPTMMLLGAGRSGTTWFGSVLARRYGARSIFEPFHPAYVKLGDLPFRPVLDARSDAPPYHDQIAAVLRGRVRSSWTDFGNEVIGKVDRRIIKEIRMCASVGYVAAHFPEIPLVGIVRNPLDNAASRRRLGWPTTIDPTAARWLRASQPDLAARLEVAETDIGRHVGIWLVDTVSLLRGLAATSAMIVSYDDLTHALQGALERVDEFTQWSPMRLDVPDRLAPRPSSNGQRVDLSRAERADVSRVLVDFVDPSNHCENYMDDLIAGSHRPQRHERRG